MSPVIIRTPSVAANKNTPGPRLTYYRKLRHVRACSAPGDGLGRKENCFPSSLVLHTPMPHPRLPILFLISLLFVLTSQATRSTELLYDLLQESDYFTPQGEFRVDSAGSPILLNCLMYKMCYYRFGEMQVNLLNLLVYRICVLK